ncbi:MAG: GNAT family N-acetyltransferase [Anaerolineae bacterium]|nr:GNAT family N-acetyltransferase [Anaerolineae bacterium]
MKIEIKSAATQQGREAITEIMAASYTTDFDCVPPEWALAYVVEEIPVSFIIIDPNKYMEFPGGDLRFAFINDVATREYRRMEGHFRALMEIAFARIQKAGIPWVLTHGRYPLYRRFGFDVFTHHAGLFITPEQITCCLGDGPSDPALLDVFAPPASPEERLVITEVRANTPPEGAAALRAAATLAHEHGREQVFFEHPPAPSYGSRYPIYATPETPFTRLVLSCGGEVRIQGADPENGRIPDADWIKVLDAATFTREAVCARDTALSLPKGCVGLVTDIGAVYIDTSSDRVHVSDIIPPDTPTFNWPTSALAQLVTGYQSAGVLNARYHSLLPDKMVTFLDTLFPQVWRLSRNESWTYKA